MSPEDEALARIAKDAWVHTLTYSVDAGTAWLAVAKAVEAEVLRRRYREDDWTQAVYYEYMDGVSETLWRELSDESREKWRVFAEKVRLKIREQRQ